MLTDEANTILQGLGGTGGGDEQGGGQVDTEIVQKVFDPGKEISGVNDSFGMIFLHRQLFWLECAF